MFVNLCGKVVSSLESSTSLNARPCPIYLVSDTLTCSNENLRDL